MMPRLLGDNPPKFVERECRHHGVTKFALVGSARGERRYRCARCSAENKERHRKRIRSALIEELGGKCERCGYDRCTNALHFHHRDPNEKEFSISKVSTSLERARLEAAKCILVCANCHAEIHADMM